MLLLLLSFLYFTKSITASLDEVPFIDLVNMLDEISGNYAKNLLTRNAQLVRKRTVFSFALFKPFLRLDTKVKSWTKLKGPLTFEFLSESDLENLELLEKPSLEISQNQYYGHTKILIPGSMIVLDKIFLLCKESNSILDCRCYFYRPKLLEPLFDGFYARMSCLFSLVCAKYPVFFRNHPFDSIETVMAIFKVYRVTREQLLAHRILLLYLVVYYALSWIGKEIRIRKLKSRNSTYDFYIKMLKSEFCIVLKALPSIQGRLLLEPYIYIPDEEGNVLEGIAKTINLPNGSTPTGLYAIDLDELMMKWEVGQDESTGTFFLLDNVDLGHTRDKKSPSFENFYQFILEDVKTR